MLVKPHFKKTRQGTGLPLPENFQFPEKCGQCSFKVRCRKRDKKDGCYSLDVQKETCNEFGNICTVPKHSRLGCKYNILLAAAKNCLNRPDLADWRRDALRRFTDGLPEGNCIQKGEECKCCCHPYRPNQEGTECVKEEEQQCPAFGAFNDWSQCLWYPLSNVAKGIKEHCQLDYKGELPPNLMQTPPGLQIPEKCGYCSFKTRCRKREKADGCFHIDAEKKACGNGDCPTCGDVCTMPKIGDSCEWGRIVGGGLLSQLDNYTKALPYWRQRGIGHLARHLPYGHCKEVNGQCKCCCHPYEPTADGTSCQLSALCSFEANH